MIQYYQNRALIYVIDNSTEDTIRIDFNSIAKTISLEKNGNSVGMIQLV